MAKFKLFFFFLIGIFSLSSCVSKKKYTLATAHVTKLRADSSNYEDRIRTLETDLSGTRKDLESTQGKLSTTTGTLNERDQLLAQKESELLDKARRMDELNKKLDAQTAALTGLRKKVADALGSFRSDELTVTMKDGKVYVSLQENLLFKSGSADVDPKGKDALGKLSAVLNVNPDIGILVEGHTDSIPMAGGRFKDNWELSTARATSIVRILTVDHKVDPDRVTAAGRGEHIPVASNKESEGRAKNRRTEIILTPDLKELFELVGP
ncbi:MAG: OmpA family protein [Bacteroidota bacterium]|nr:OmpA family protein [Bacteroidota bacterium]